MTPHSLISYGPEGVYLEVQEARRLLSVEEVYSARFGAGEEPGGELASLVWPPDLMFSRYTARPSIALELTGDGVVPAVSLVMRNGEPVRIKALPISSQAIIGSKWHPILKEDHLALTEMLEVPAGGVPGRISLSDYIRMCRHPSADRILGAARNPSQEIVSALVRYDDGSQAASLAPDVELRPYQQVGWRWLAQMATIGTGGVLADEMGLGKTLQVIALISARARSDDRPTLLIVPSSLVPNWRRELLRFAPHLSWIVHRGPGRATSWRDLEEFNVVITTYDILSIDRSLFIGIDWSLFAFDEAHVLRNADTERFRAISFVRSKYPKVPTIAITGTPIQNSLRDAWALFELVVPGYCGARVSFSERYCDDVSGALALEPRLSPFMLRRLVKDVAQDLPALIQIPQELEMSESEALGYEALRVDLAASPGGMLAAITPLRMWCCHPRLRAPDWMAADIASTTKFARLVEIILDIRRLGEKALIFTSYNEMARLIVEHFSLIYGISCNAINGETLPENRQTLIDNFTAIEGSALLVMNPQAAGVGLNIQAANHVIHYNLEWNPAVEEQATARAHRHGQAKPVRVHRLFYRHTLEEVVNARVELKRQLVSTAVRGVTGDESSDLAIALALSPIRAESSDNSHQRS